MLCFGALCEQGVSISVLKVFANLNFALVAMLTSSSSSSTQLSLLLQISSAASQAGVAAAASNDNRYLDIAHLKGDFIPWIF